MTGIILLVTRPSRGQGKPVPLPQYVNGAPSQKYEIFVTILENKRFLLPHLENGLYFFYECQTYRWLDLEKSNRRDIVSSRVVDYCLLVIIIVIFLYYIR